MGNVATRIMDFNTVLDDPCRACQDSNEAGIKYATHGFCVMPSYIAPAVLEELENDMLFLSMKSQHKNNRGPFRSCVNSYKNFKKNSYWAFLTSITSRNSMFYIFMVNRFGPDCWWLDSTMGGDVVRPGARFDRSTYPHTDCHTGRKSEPVVVVSLAV